MTAPSRGNRHPERAGPGVVTEDVDAEAHRVLAALASGGATRRVAWRSSA